MTKAELLTRVEALTADRQVDWMIRLGSNLTIVARDAYPFNGRPGNLMALQGFNELQHQVYGRVRSLRQQADWTCESFVQGLLDRAAHYRIAVGLDWALHRSVNTPEEPHSDQLKQGKAN